MARTGDIFDYGKLRRQIRESNLLLEKPKSMAALLHYFQRIGYGWKLMFLEKELFTFTLLQWISIAVGYYLFVMMLYWIPPEVWKSTQNSDSGSIADLVVFLWIIVCVGVAAMPLSIFSSCIAVVHMLDYYEQKPSTIAACLKIVLPRIWQLWLFHWLDGYYTVRQVMERMPKKNDRTTTADRAVSEVLYHTWKIASMAIVPNLITGRTIMQTCENSLGQIKEHAAEMLLVRAGYSILCWIVAILTYVGTVLGFGWLQESFFPGELHDTIATAYLYLGIPALTSIAFIQVFLRPAYMIALTDIFGIYMIQKREVLIKDAPPAPATSAIVAYGLLCVVVLTIYLYREPLGIMDMLATPYGQEYIRK